MSNNFRLPLTNNIYNKHSRSESGSNKENKPNNTMNGNTFATPSEDDFDDDDDELLIAASQQVEKKMAQEKAEAAAKNAQSYQLQGEIAILRDQALKLNREKDHQRIKHAEELKSIEQKYKKDMENLKSKLEFKDRDIEELKTKIQADSSRGEAVQSAKRPRLSVVKEPKPSRGSTSSTSLPTQSSLQYRISNHLTPSSAALSNFSTLHINELNSDSEHRNLTAFSRGLRNNLAIQKRFNIKHASQKCVPSKEIVMRISEHFKQIDKLSDWSSRRVCLRILSDLLTYNTYPNVEQEMKKLLAAIQKSSSKEEHSTLSQTIRHSGVNVFAFCTGGSGSCMLSSLYRYKCVEVTALLASSVSQAATVRYCSCSDRLIRYLCEQIGDSIEGDISSPTLVITNETLLITCLQLLSSLAPHFPEMKLSVTSQTLFYGALCHLKRCPDLSMSGMALVDVLYEANFELNTSMSA